MDEIEKKALQALREKGREAEADEKALAEAKEKAQARVELPTVDFKAIYTTAEAEYKAAEIAYQKALNTHTLDEKALAEAKSNPARKAKGKLFAESLKALKAAEAEKTRLYSAFEAARLNAEKAASAEKKAASKASGNASKRISEKKADVILPVDYKLDFLASGVKYYAEKWNAQAAEILVRQDYIAKDGSLADRHVILSCGSMFDRIDSVTIRYSFQDRKAQLRLRYFETDGKRFEIVSGFNDEKTAIKPQVLAYPSGKNQGKPILPEAKDVDSCRFTLAKVIPYCMPYLSSRFNSETASASDTLSEALQKAQEKLEKLADRIADAEIDGKPTEALEKAAEALQARITELTAKIAEALNGRKAELTPEQKAEAEKRQALKAEKKAAILAKYQAMKAQAATPESTPEAV